MHFSHAQPCMTGPNQNPSRLRCAQRCKSGPITSSTLALFAMYDSPTMDGLTYHGHYMNSKRQNKLTQSVGFGTGFTN